MILLDTHVLVWLANKSEQLTTTSLDLIASEKLNKSIYVSSITIWEIAMLVNAKRLVLSVDLNHWVSQIEKAPYIKFVPVGNRIAIDANNLPGKFHKDPADRIIVATARTLGAKLITADVKIRKYKHVSSVW
jgi:PIN domain nuclease of toxin-antitoxin system